MVTVANSIQMPQGDGRLIPIAAKITLQRDVEESKTHHSFVIPIQQSPLAFDDTASLKSPFPYMQLSGTPAATLSAMFRELIYNISKLLKE